MKADPNTHDEVEAIIRKMSEAYKARNLKEVKACFAPDDDVSLVGTGADETRIGPGQIQEQAERDWAHTECIEMAFSRKRISAAGSVAWVFADGAFNVRAEGQAMTLPVRVSIVLEKRRDRWLIVHAHFSTAAAAQERAG